MKSFEEKEMATYDEMISGIMGPPFEYRCQDGMATIVDAQGKKVAELSAVRYGCSTTASLLALAPGALGKALEHCVLLRNRLDKTRERFVEMEIENYRMSLRLTSLKRLLGSEDLQDSRKLSLLREELELPVMAPTGNRVYMANKISNQRKALRSLEDSKRATHELLRKERTKKNELAKENEALHIRLNSFGLERLKNENRNLKATADVLNRENLSFRDTLKKFFVETQPFMDKSKANDIILGSVSKDQEDPDRVVNLDKASEILGVPRSELYSRLREYGPHLHIEDELKRTAWYAWKESLPGGGRQWVFKLSDAKAYLAGK